MAEKRNRLDDDTADIRRFKLMPSEQVAKELRRANIDPRRAIERVKELVNQKLKEWNGGHRRGLHEALMFRFASLQQFTTALQCGCAPLHYFVQRTAA